LPVIRKKFGFPEKKFDTSSALKQTDKVKGALVTFKNNNFMKTKNASLKNNKKK
jgi:hypothetical protein